MTMTTILYTWYATKAPLDVEYVWENKCLI